MCLTPNLPEPQPEVEEEMLIGCSGRYDYCCYVSRPAAAAAATAAAAAAFQK